MKKTLVLLGTLFLVLVLAYVFHIGGTREGVSRSDIRKMAAPKGHGLDIGDRNTRVMNSKGNLRVDGDGNVLTLNGNTSGLRLRDPNEEGNKNDLTNDNGDRFTFESRPREGGTPGETPGEKPGETESYGGPGGRQDWEADQRMFNEVDNNVGGALDNMIDPRDAGYMGQPGEEFDKLFPEQSGPEPPDEALGEGF